MQGEASCLSSHNGQAPTWVFSSPWPKQPALTPVEGTSGRYEQFVGYKTTFRLLNSVEKQLASDANEAGVTTLRNSDMKVRAAPLH